VSYDRFHEAALRGLETGFTVASIASSPLTTCGPDDNPEDVLKREHWKDFDAIPVKDEGRIVAVIERGTGQKRVLDSSILVSASQPLREFLATPGLAEDGYRLVLSGSEIDGVVTPSDLLRLPVRVFAFALLARIEPTMIDVLQERNLSMGEWIPWLSERRQREIVNRERRMSANRLNPDMIEFTQFGEKVEILLKLDLISETTAEAAGRLTDLRNQIAHQRGYADDKEGLRLFLKRLQQSYDFIEVLEILAVSPDLAAREAG